MPSTGSVPVGSGGARRPSDRVLDVLFSLILLLMAFGAFLWGYILLLRKDIAVELRAGEDVAPGSFPRNDPPGGGETAQQGEGA